MGAISQDASDFQLQEATDDGFTVLIAGYKVILTTAIGYNDNNND